MSTHECPGVGCQRQVPRHLFACPGCWSRLPAVLQRRITSSYRRRAHDEHVRAMLLAVEFYRQEAA